MTIDEAVQFIKGCKRIAFWALSKPEQDRVFAEYCKAWKVLNEQKDIREAATKNVQEKGSIRDCNQGTDQNWRELETQQDNHLPIPMRCV